MTEVRAMSRNGYTLVYDTDDIENTEVSTLHHSVEVGGPGNAVHRELTGYSSLDLHIDFKHGKRALWVKDDEEPTP